MFLIFAGLLSSHHVFSVGVQLVVRWLLLFKVVTGGIQCGQSSLKSGEHNCSLDNITKICKTVGRNEIIYAISLLATALVALLQ